MPELPEVETIKLELAQLIAGQKIESVQIKLEKQVKTPPRFFVRRVAGARVKTVARRAKLLILKLDNGYSLVFHLKMTGQLIYRKKGKLAGGGHPIAHNLKNLLNQYSHVIFNFSDGSSLFFNDLRQFGWVKLADNPELKKIENEFGPEPLEINFNQFRDLFRGKKSVLKPLLMDQKFIAGIGNIYAAESLFCAGALPTRRSDSLNGDELKRLYDCLRRVLKLAIRHKGTSAADYVDAFGRQGSMEKYLQVYRRAGEQCRQCGHKLKLIRQGQRATVYCAFCQK